MYFSNARKHNERPNIFVNGHRINNVDEFKYLGVILDSTLTFRKHIKKMCNTLRYHLANFRFIRNALSTVAAKAYLHAMILSPILYCISSWSQASRMALNPVRSLYNQSLKVLDKKPRRHHHCDLLFKYKMLSLDNQIMFSDVRLIHKIIHNAAPPPLKTFVQPRSEVLHRALRSVSRGDCSVPQRKTAFSQSAFSYKATSEWNRLPEYLKHIPDYHKFNCEVKNWILSQQSCQH